MTVREWIDAALQETQHKGSGSPDYATWAQRAALYGQQAVEYVWDYDDWDFKHATASLAVTADSGRVAGPTDLSIEGPHGGLYVNGQQWEIKWIPARYLFYARELENRSGNYPLQYTVAQQTSTYVPYIYFDRTSHGAFTGTLYYQKTRPRIYYVKVLTGPTAALIAATPGNVDNGAHTYKVTFVTAAGETDGGTVSNSVTVADKTVAGQIALTAIPVATGDPATVVTSRKLYRTAAGGTQHKLLATISDNTTTTYTDNIADASLTTNIPTTDTTGEALKQIPEEYHRGVLLEGLRYFMRENVADERAEKTNFPLFTTALAKMRTQRTYGMQEDQRFGDLGYPTQGMW